MSSSGSLAAWYSGKNILITGASGFLGICLLEKILRALPNAGDIYLLLRAKKGKEASERLEDIKKNLIFEKLLETKSAEQLFAKVKVVGGDVGSPNLGLSPEDRRLLTDNVNVIIHSAATLDFAEGLKTTVQINLLGTREMLTLASQCRNLGAFVYVSSTYVNSWRLQADEIIYPLKEDPEKIISLVQKLSEKELDEITPKILGDHPNTYTITKHMAEHEVQKMEERFPCTIVRPSMIIGAWKEPVPGWTISKNGPQGFLLGASKGVIRRLPVGKELIYDYIPVDVVVNELLVAGFHAGSTNAKKVEVYHSCSSTRKPFRWVSVEDGLNIYLHKYPLKGAIWYPHLKLLPSITWFKISAFFVHILPAILLDTVTRISGGRPILMRLHRNVGNSLNRLQKFIFTEWSFGAERTTELHRWMSADDRADFYIDISDLSWIEVFDNLTKGVRRYLSNEKPSNLESARGKDTMLMVIHLAFQALVYSLIWYTFACIFGATMTGTAFIVPVFYVLFSFL